MPSVSTFRLTFPVPHLLLLLTTRRTSLCSPRSQRVLLDFHAWEGRNTLVSPAHTRMYPVPARVSLVKQVVIVMLQEARYVVSVALANLQAMVKPVFPVASDPILLALLLIPTLLLPPRARWHANGVRPVHSPATKRRLYVRRVNLGPLHQPTDQSNAIHVHQARMRAHSARRVAQHVHWAVQRPCQP